MLMCELDIMEYIVTMEELIIGDYNAEGFFDDIEEDEDDED